MTQARLVSICRINSIEYGRMSKQSRFHAGVTKSVQSLNLVADVLRLVLYIFVYFLYFCVSWL